MIPTNTTPLSEIPEGGIATIDGVPVVFAATAEARGFVPVTTGYTQYERPLLLNALAPLKSCRVVIVLNHPHHEIWRHKGEVKQGDEE